MEVTAGRLHDARRLQPIVCAVALLVIGVTGPAVPIASPQSALSGGTGPIDVEAEIVRRAASEHRVLVF